MKRPSNNRRPLPTAPAAGFELVVESAFLNEGRLNVLVAGSRREVAEAYLTAMEKTADGDVDLAIVKNLGMGRREYVSWDTPNLESWAGRPCALFAD